MNRNIVSTLLVLNVVTRVKIRERMSIYEMSFLSIRDTNFTPAS